MTHNSYPFEGKTVIVTGGGSGIGRAIARAFLDNGANVAVSGRRLAPLQETLTPYPAERILPVVNDLAEPGGAQNLIDAVTARFGKVDVVVSNAAAFVAGDLLDVEAAVWEQLRATNIDGFFHLAQAALPALATTGGNLVAISSVSGAGGDWQQAVYNASKHAINGFVRSLALDWGGRGVRVNAVAPAFTLTEMTAHMAEEPGQLAPFVNRVALERPGRPDDIAPAVLFLASPDAGYITGAILTVDGGTSASTGQAHVA